MSIVETVVAVVVLLCTMAGWAHLVSWVAFDDCEYRHARQGE